ncbi:non-specific lipid-transfer protein P5 [Abrus precatorius]|uniref:Non-specific lipid-transfer protein P5 n=1 Tax=Abrus precatorius TaxID=3816 RepID=A0A8B8L7M2_ABRPR|nr:non-specific lipid-transfer protein P5 [Abrus precatorius]
MTKVQVVKVSGVALIICIVALGTPLLAMATLTCCDVKPVLETCACYVKSGGDTVPTDCCYAVLALRDQVMNCSQSRRIACHCLQDAARRQPYINATAYAVVPDKCGVPLPFQFSYSMNCDLL